MILPIAAAALRCGPGTGEGMAPAPPPAGWAERLAAERRDKDASFRTDPESPLLEEDRRGFKGLDYWPLDPAYRFVGPIHRLEHPERFTILSTTGKPRPCEWYGTLSFDLKGTACVLRVYRLLDIGDPPGTAGLFLPFTDATTGRESYPAGRYVDLEGPDGGPYVLDFNRAYDPLCAYGAPERFACPVTPKENRLRVAVEAGERGYHRERAPS